MANPLAPFTLVAATAHTFTLDADYSTVEVLNVDGAAEVFFTVDGSAPTVDGAGCLVLPAAIGSLGASVEGAAVSVVKAISAGTPKVSVRGIH